VVLMDCQMPEMDGYEATRRLRDPVSEVLDCSIPVIAMTAHALAGDREKCLAAGMNDYLTKPIEPKRLRALLETLVARDGASASACASPNEQAVLLSAIDVAGLRDLTGGDDGFLLDLLTTFIESAGTMVRQLEVAVVQNDDQALLRAAHQLKGCAANIRASKLAEVADRLCECAPARRSEVLVVLQSAWTVAEAHVVALCATLNHASQAASG